MSHPLPLSLSFLPSTVHGCLNQEQWEWLLTPPSERVTDTLTVLIDMQTRMRLERQSQHVSTKVWSKERISLSLQSCGKDMHIMVSQATFPTPPSSSNTHTQRERERERERETRSTSLVLFWVVTTNLDG